MSTHVDHKLQLQNVTKTFFPSGGLGDCSLTLGLGETVGLFGLNGAGKTTMLKLIAGLLKPSSGSISVFGQSPRKMRRQVSFLGDGATFLPWMDTKQISEVMAALYQDFRPSRFFELVQALSVPQKSFGQLSRGQRQKSKIAAALARNTAFYLLDEPLSGLDLLSRESIVQAIRTAQDQQKTLVVATHEIKELEPVVERGVFLDQGMIVADLQKEKQGLMEHFRQLFGYEK